MRGLRDRHAVVTGAGSGIGRAIALRLAQEGCAVSNFDIDQAGMAETVAIAAQAGGKARAHRVDITDFARVKAGVAAAEDALGPIHILVNNAGWDRFVPFLQTDFELWQKIIAINLYGPLHMHYAVLPGMAKRKDGRIVNIASDAGRVGSSGEAVYAACKGGVIAFSKTLAREFARSNINVNVVCPGPTETPLLAEAAASDFGAKIAAGLKSAIPLRRLGQPDDFPGVVAFLASADASYITGQTISVSGGLTMHG